MARAIVRRVKEGDKGPTLRFTLLKPDGTAWNLGGATVTLVLSGGLPQKRLERACTVDNPGAGECSYALTAADTEVPGNYELECIIDYGASKYTTITRGELKILGTL